MLDTLLILFMRFHFKLFYHSGRLRLFLWRILFGNERKYSCKIQWMVNLLNDCRETTPATVTTTTLSMEPSPSIWPTSTSTSTVSSIPNIESTHSNLMSVLSAEKILAYRHNSGLPHLKWPWFHPGFFCIRNPSCGKTVWVDLQHSFFTASKCIRLLCNTESYLLIHKIIF